MYTFKPSLGQMFASCDCVFGDTLSDSSRIRHSWPVAELISTVFWRENRVCRSVFHMISKTGAFIGCSECSACLRFEFHGLSSDMPVAQQRLPPVIQTRIAREWIETNLSSSLYNIVLVSRHFRHFRALATLPMFKRPKPELIGGMS